MNNYSITTLASHSSLQIFKGAKEEGFETLAICLKDRANFYRRFGFIDRIIQVDSYKDFYEVQKNIIKHNPILIPHGSITAYLGSDYADRLEIPHFGNTQVLEWEVDRVKQMKWLQQSKIRLPALIDNPSGIKQPVIVKMFGAKGGTGYFLARNRKEFSEKIKRIGSEQYIIQEYMVGTPVYLQYFYSPIKKEIELLGIDRRYETNVDGLSRIPPFMSDAFMIEPSYTVIGNFPMVIRESLLPLVYEMGESIVNTSKALMPPHGLYGPFCLETIVTPNQAFYAIEISCRIVAGTNLYISGSPYSDLLFGPGMSTGRRVAREIKTALEKGKLKEILN